MNAEAKHGSRLAAHLAKAAAGSLEELSAAIESGAGMPAVARAAARALDASVALIDRASNVLAVAAASPDEERKLLAGGAGVETVELRVADTAVGELRWRPRGEDRARRRPAAHGGDPARAGARALALARVGDRGGGR